MVGVEETFGKGAGKVWKALNEGSILTVSQIAKKANMPPSGVHGALGWLAREGKVDVVSGNVTKYKLK
jgi:DNA-binding IclR family transcriptional regulator